MLKYLHENQYSRPIQPRFSFPKSMKSIPNRKRKNACRRKIRFSADSYAEISVQKSIRQTYFLKPHPDALPYTTLSYILTVEYYFYFFFCWERNGYLIMTTRFRGLPPNKNQASPDFLLDNRLSMGYTFGVELFFEFRTS